MFDAIEEVPGDAILGLMDLFKDDASPYKIDLGVGVYRDEDGQTPIMRAVKMAEQYLVDNEKTKTYVSPQGNLAYAGHMTKLVLGSNSPLIANDRGSATQALGGTGALSLAIAFVTMHLPGKTVWIPDPTWGNHLWLLEAAGAKTKKYPYVDADNRFDFAAMSATLERIPEGDIVLLHACCHNPSGFDPDHAQWQKILEILQQRKLFPIVDFAYQGFGNGLTDDAYAARLLAENLNEMFICQSNSKNFGMYRERIGNLITVSRNAKVKRAVRSQMDRLVRANYSNPPAHGANVIETIFASSELHDIWEQELGKMRHRIIEMRKKFVQGFAPLGLDKKFAFINEQNGMFSYTGLSESQVLALRKDYSIYMVGSGRINIAGLNDASIAYVCKSIAEVIQQHA